MAIPVLDNFAVTLDNNAVETLTVSNEPTSIAVGDVLILMVVADIENEQTDTWNTPTGFTKIVGLFPSNNNVDCSGISYFRVASADSGDDNPVVTWSGASQAIAWYCRVTGADVLDVVNIAGVDAQANGDLVIPSVTTDEANTLAFYFNSFDGGDGLPFAISGTGWAEVSEQQTCTTGGCSSGSFGTKDQASAAATGDATLTTNVNDGSIGVQFAINESAAVGANPKGPLGMPLQRPLVGPL